MRFIQTKAPGQKFGRGLVSIVHCDLSASAATTASAVVTATAAATSVIAATTTPVVTATAVAAAAAVCASCVFFVCWHSTIWLGCNCPALQFRFTFFWGCI